LHERIRLQITERDIAFDILVEVDPPTAKEVVSAKFVHVKVTVRATDANDAPDVAARLADATFPAKVMYS
jgi:hypothetical protein